MSLTGECGVEVSEAPRILLLFDNSLWQFTEAQCAVVLRDTTWKVPVSPNKSTICRKLRRLTILQRKRSVFELRYMRQREPGEPRPVRPKVIEFYWGSLFKFGLVKFSWILLISPGCTENLSRSI